MTGPTTPKPENPHRMLGRLIRACELADNEYRMTHGRYNKTAAAYEARQISAAALEADQVALREAERRAEAAHRYRAAFEKIYTYSIGFASGFGMADVVPFQLAWPEPRVYVPGIPNPHVPPPKLSSPPRPPRRAPAQIEPTKEASPAPKRGDRDETRRTSERTRPAEPVAPSPSAPLGNEPAIIVRLARDAVPMAPSDAVESSPDPAAAPAEPAEASPVGYKCPPEKGKFRKGDGRPRPGRPKGSKNMKTLVIKSASRKVIVTENGHKRSITRLEALVETAMIAGLGKNVKDRAYAIGLAQRYIPDEEPEAAAQLSDDDKAILKSQAALLGMLGEDEDDGGET